jgi:hypothetical protein
MMARRPSSCKAVSETGVNHLVKFHYLRFFPGANGSIVWLEMVADSPATAFDWIRSSLE